MTEEVLEIKRQCWISYCSFYRLTILPDSEYINYILQTHPAGLNLTFVKGEKIRDTLHLHKKEFSQKAGKIIDNIKFYGKE